MPFVRSGAGSRTASRSGFLAMNLELLSHGHRTMARGLTSLRVLIAASTNQVPSHDAFKSNAIHDCLFLLNNEWQET